MEEQKQSDIKEHESGIKYKEFKDENDKVLRVFATDSAKRLDFETYDEYRFRRDVNNYLHKQRRKGHHFWPSYIPLNNGRVLGNTYIKEKAEKIKEQVINKQKEGENNG